MVLPNFDINIVLDSFSEGRPSTGSRMLWKRRCNKVTEKEVMERISATEKKKYNRERKLISEKLDKNDEKKALTK
jgi:hypothetical protein